MVVDFPRRIKAAALNRSFLFEFPVNGSTKPKGIDGALLELLSQIFTFEYQVISPIDGEYGKLTEDGDWSGIVGMVSRSEADFGMSFIYPTIPRLKVVDFSFRYIITDLTFATNHPGTYPAAYSYIHAFDIYTWMCLAALLILMPAVFQLLVKNCSYIDTQMAVFGHLLRTSIPMKKVFEKKPLTVLWYLCAYILSVSYAASTSSLLFTPLDGRRIETIQELNDALTGDNFKVKAIKGDPYVTNFILSPSEHIKSIGESIVRNNWYFKTDFDPHEEMTDVAIISPRLTLNIRLGIPPFSSKYISGDSFHSICLGMAIRKNFCCKELLNLALSRIVEVGIMNKFVRDEVQRSMHDNMHHSVDSLVSHEIRALSVKDLSGTFKIFMGGLGLSLIGLVSEMIYYKFCCWRRR